MAVDSFKTDPKREATDSFRGYRYQAFQSVLAWMRLGREEILVLEGAEDFDLHEPDKKAVTTGQIKDLSSNITLRSKSVKEALNNYWAHRRRNNNNYQITFRFMTTANAGQEKDNPFGKGVKGIELWERSRRDGEIDLSPLRNFLLKQNLDMSLKEFIADSDKDALRDQLITPIYWDLGQKPKEALIDDIYNRLIIHGEERFDKISPYHARQVLPHLLHSVESLMESRGDRSLRYSNFLTAFEEATTETVSRGQLQQLRAAANPLTQELRDQHVVSHGPTALGHAIPLVDGVIPRENIVADLGCCLQRHRALFLQGSSGLGKTTLAHMITDSIEGDWVWSGFRGRGPEQVRDLLARVNFEITAQGLPAQVVLDDIDLAGVSTFERELQTLLFSVTNSDGCVIVTSPSECPSHLFPKAWLSEECQVSVPYFEESDIAEMIKNHGLDHGKWTNGWARLIYLTTSGHPQLIHARVRNLQAQGWPKPEVSDLTNPEDVQKVKTDARMRLLNELPSDNVRELAYRLSLITGSFSRDLALFVASVTPSISLPGEAFDVLLGPWIEQEQTNQFRISPLISSAGRETLLPQQQNSVHEAICIDFIKRKSLNQFEIGTALSHALVARSGIALTKLAGAILQTPREHLPSLEGGLFWFSHIALNKGQVLFNENAVINFSLRLAQYQIAASGSEPENALQVIDRLLDDIERIDEPHIRAGNEVMSYMMILSTPSVPIASRMVVDMLSRLLDLDMSEEIPAELAILVRENDEANFGGLSRPQILFSLQATRLKGLDDMAELLDTLDTLEEKKRNTLLDVCNSNFDFADLLVSGAWYKETVERELDVGKAINVLQQAVSKGRKWNRLALVRAAFVAMSVIWDEYGHSPEKALEVLEKASKEFPEDKRLKNQLAKVLFHDGKFERSQELSKIILENPGDLSDVEAVFTCRSAGICAARLDNWPQAGELFLKGAEWAKQTQVQDLMALGLKADAAFALWKQGKRQKSIELYAQVLSELEKIPITDEYQNRHLHATIRCCIAWTQQNIRNKNDPDSGEPYPGFCSNEGNHEVLKDLEIISTDKVWGLLAGTEICLGLDLGISKKAEKKMGDQVPAMILINNKTMAFDGIWERLDFDNLIPCLAEFYESVAYSTALRQKGADRWNTGQIPHLSEGYWQDQSNKEALHHHLIAAAIVMTCQVPDRAIPIDQWRDDMAKRGMNTADTEMVLRILSGDGIEPTQSLYDQAAYAIFQLRTEERLAPNNLFMCFFRLLNALGPLAERAATSLEEIAINHWTFAADSQRFAFSNPSTSCDLIKKECANQNLSGYAKVASILAIAATGLRMPLSDEAENMLSENEPDLSD